MPGFKIINNTSEIKLNNNWVSSTKFNSKDRLVDAKGNSVSSDYKGRQYRIIEKRERNFSTPERIGRGFLGTLAVVCTLFLALFSKTVRNLFTKPKENVRFAVLKEPDPKKELKQEIDKEGINKTKEDLEKGKDELKKGIDVEHNSVGHVDEPKKEVDKTKGLEQAKEELEKGLQIPLTTIDKIQALIPKILRQEDDDGIEYMKGSKVFRVKEMPNLVFKMGVSSGGRALINGKWLDNKEQMEERFENMVKAKEVCLVNNLGLIIIPHARKFTFDTYDGRKCVLIAEECMDINHEESAQEEFYHKYSKELNETARQLAIFVAKTGFNDVTPRNIPIINESEDFHGHRRVALIDLEHMGSIRNGFTGDGNGSCGLVGCVSEEQIDIVIAEARKNGIAISDTNKKRRLQEIESNKKLRQHYENKGIVTGKEPIQVDIDSLGLNLAEEGEIRVYIEGEDGKTKREKQKVTMRIAAEDVIKEINRLIQEKSDKESTNGKRYILLNTHDDPFSEYNNLGVPANQFSITVEEEKKLWLNRIIQALVDKGHIFKLVKVNGHGYFIQA